VQPFFQKIDWRAELISPPAKGTAAGSANILTSQGTVESGQRSIAGAWQVASDDESGEYQVKVYLNGRLAAAFRFNLH